MKDTTLVNLASEMCRDAYGSILGMHPMPRKSDLQLDLEAIQLGYMSEGISYLTTTLPEYGECFDRLVFRGEIPKQRMKFLRPFWVLAQEGAFDRRPEALRTIRTFLSGFKKLELPIEEEKRNEKLRAYLQNEEKLTDLDVPQTPSTYHAQWLLHSYLDRDFECKLPRHGPGAVAGYERGNEKWNLTHLYTQAHESFPWYDYFYGIRSIQQSHSGVETRMLHLASLASEYKQLRRCSQPTSRMLMVPKDSRGPRIISCEPKELMYLQQGLAHDMMSYIERHPWTRGHLNFTDQNINNRLALESSASLLYDTLDLSDASDLVSTQLVTFLFPRNISKQLLSLRSTHTMLQDGRVMPLAKYAPMGSALCFPVESLCFWALCVGAILAKDGLQAFDTAIQSVYVYGDDIIIHGEYTDCAIEALESVGLVVNKAKSFIGQSVHFRESCGVDAYKGTIVTPIRVRKQPPSGPRDGSALETYAALSDNLRPVCPRASTYCESIVEGIVGRIPRVPFKQSYLAFVDPVNYWGLDQYAKHTNVKWSESRQYYVGKLLRLVNKRVVSDFSDNWWRLLYGLLNEGHGDPTRVVVRGATQIRRDMCSIEHIPAEGPPD